METDTPKLPRLVFLPSGDVVIVYFSTPIIKDGQEWLRVYMKLPEDVKKTYKIKENDQDYADTAEGIYVKQYPKEYIKQNVSNNPFSPLWVAHCSFMEGNPDLDDEVGMLRKKIIGYKMELKISYKTIAELRATIRRLSEGLEKIGGKE